MKPGRERTGSMTDTLRATSKLLGLGVRRGRRAMPTTGGVESITRRDFWALLSESEKLEVTEFFTELNEKLGPCEFIGAWKIGHT